MSNKGWECPKCNKVYAPWKSECDSCNEGHPKRETEGIPPWEPVWPWRPPYEPIPGSIPYDYPTWKFWDVWCDSGTASTDDNVKYEVYS